ncbi:MAG: GLPGLI family protein [Bacteroidota bacterium]
MKQLLTFLLFALFLIPSLKAQVQYGTIDYIRTVEREIQFEGMEQNKEIKAMLAKMAAAGAFTENYKATFGPDGFTFVQQVKEATSMESEMAGGAVIVMETGGEDPSHFYTDVKNATVANTQYIFDKSFLVMGDAAQVSWTITDEVVPPSDATIGLDLTVAMGITQNGDTITAGFAPSLPVQVGPQNIYGLPGAIITLTFPQKDGGSVVFRATSMSLSTEPLELVKPTEGKKITPEKFSSEQKKRQRTMTRTIMRG